MTDKEYMIQVLSDTGSSHFWKGTLDYLIDEVFGYTLECNGMGRLFKRPKTVKALVNHLNCGNSYWSRRNSYRVVKNGGNHD